MSGVEESEQVLKDAESSIEQLTNVTSAYRQPQDEASVAATDVLAAAQEANAQLQRVLDGVRV